MKNVEFQTKSVKRATPPGGRWLLAFAWLCAALLGRGQTVDSLTLDAIEPWGVVVDRTNNIYYVTESAQNRILKINLALNDTRTLASGKFFNPEGIILARGGLVVSDSGNHVIRFVSLAGAITDIAGSPTSVSGFVDAVGAAARFRSPGGLASDAAGNIYVADTQNNALRRIAPDNTVTTVSTNLYRPQGVTVDTLGRVFVADTGNHIIRMINTNGVVTTIGGFEGHRGFANGLSSEFSDPHGLLWVGGDTGLIIADKGNGSVRNLGFNSATGEWQAGVIAGFAGVRDVAPKDGALESATFGGPTGVALDRDDNIVVADLSGYLMRRVKRATAGDPIMTPTGGFFTNSLTVTVTNTTPGTVFYYTTDGQTPSPYSPTTTNLLTFSNGPDVLLKVRAYSPDFASSRVVSNVYHFFVDTPLISPDGVFTNNDVEVTLTSKTVGARIYYAMNAEPTTNSTLYTGPFFVRTNGTLRVKAFRDGFDPSFETSARYFLTCSPPVISPLGMDSRNPVEVTITSDTVGAKIYWTIDSSVPGPTSMLYTGKFLLTTNGWLRAVAIKDGYTNSFASDSAFSAFFGLRTGEPRIIPDGLFTNNAVQVRFDSETTNAIIHWTIDGVNPTATTGFVSPANGTFLLATSGVVRAIATYQGFVPSFIFESRFILAVDRTEIQPSGVRSNNDVVITLANKTIGAKLYWAVDAEPTTSSILYTNPFVLKTNGLLRVKGFRDGFEDGPENSAFFDLITDRPTMQPPGGSFSNAVSVTVASGTSNAVIRFTTNGTLPNVNSPILPGTSATYSNSGPLTIQAYRDGFVASDILINEFVFFVARPGVTMGGTRSSAGDAWINQASVTFSSATLGAQFAYTTDGSDPQTNTARVVVAGGVPVIVTTNSQVRVRGIRDGFTDSDLVSMDVFIQVAKPVMSPSAGYFPQGTNVSVSVVGPTNTVVYYRYDGAIPTTNDFLYTGPIRVDAVTAGGLDLRSVSVRAFAPNTLPSDVVTGNAVPVNSMGVPTDVVGGIGSTVIIPIVLNVGTGVEAQTVQFRFQVSPVSAAVSNLTTDIRPALIGGTNDFVQITTSQGNGTFVLNRSTFQTTNTGNGVVTNIMVVVAAGSDSNFRIKDFGVVTLMAVSIPAGAHVGDRYTIEVLAASATTNAQQAVLTLTNLQARTLIVSNVSYTVGDTSPGSWYNAGDFGNSKLDNADVNNAFYASLGVRTPYVFSDVFDAMDVYPEDTTFSAGGDGRIRFLDWQYILYRSVGIITNNYTRAWAVDGIRTAAAAPAFANTPATVINYGLSGSLTHPEARLTATTFGNVIPGTTLRVPVRLNIVSGKRVAGLQFRAAVRASLGAPAITAVSFTASSALVTPTPVTGLAANETAVAWPLLMGKLDQPLQGDQAIGELVFTVPSGAKSGDLYSIEFLNADGAADLNTPYDIEGVGAYAAVGTAAPTVERFAPGFKLNWHAEAAVKYVVESTDDLGTGKWKVEAADIMGRGRTQEFYDQNPGTRAKFYRVRPVY